ncbi:MAG: hypothetical protein AB1797_08135 [bacterium]
MGYPCFSPSLLSLTVLDARCSILDTGSFTSIEDRASSIEDRASCDERLALTRCSSFFDLRHQIFRG